MGLCLLRTVQGKNEERVQTWWIQGRIAEKGPSDFTEYNESTWAFGEIFSPKGPTTVYGPVERALRMW